MRKRIIPVLLVDQRRRLVKTIGFGPRTYVGDPFNVIRLFNEKEVDEICVLDIDASPLGRSPDLGFLRELASECFMPMAYGGGITAACQCESLNRAGIEKFVLGRSASDLGLVRELASTFGSQATVACVDVANDSKATRHVVQAGRPGVSLNPLDHCKRLEDAGAGEIILQSIDRDGTRNGYDLDLIRAVAPHLSVPTVALGGAGEAIHLAQALHAGASAAASGSAFVFIGRLRAVLVSYPSMLHMDALNDSLS
ncbi:HisA/HisF-related TIM barrel protein [Hydrogenophaga crocea]|uniref:Imidazole glycerol phosphate synthase subunit HisF n=1 Tax=Hydrogenophaga crocea TaxID=2716225 RepID=A0A6G8ILT1_9BURK|nr:HisA/HisF-related TIM barrel protein [Hydrogenophaga crocea]QIM53985.1 imidazole glycerol phosphate synthase subunit HisF [Hydrogenophaga crocea]